MRIVDGYQQKKTEAKVSEMYVCRQTGKTRKKKVNFFFFNLKLQLKTKSKCTKRPSKKD